MTIGIEDISFYTTDQYLDLSIIADKYCVDIDKFHVGLGQERISIISHDEDIVTMAASAALPIIEDNDKKSIKALFFATESSIDQSKSAGIWLHKLLGLNSSCRVIEFKQACYSATCALHMACALVAKMPQHKILIVASDIARYDIGSSGEPTQGCGAVAILVSSNASVIEIEPITGLYTDDVMDFWRPNYSNTALFDGKYSTKIYLQSLKSAWQDYQNNNGYDFNQFQYFCYHQPFTRMAEKAHIYLSKTVGKDLSSDEIKEAIGETMIYNRLIGNSYTASLYLSFISLLDHSSNDISGKRIGFFSYGSGCMAEFFSGIVKDDYKKKSHKEYHRNILDSRTPVDYQTYCSFHNNIILSDKGNIEIPAITKGPFRLVAIRNHKRIYEKTNFEKK
ncbi:hydroxymethylglutaryl-CoA synthase [Candidatus Liberibacter americanus]|uniref:3-hydroxy-3-methylglutaryl CoA synthase n=1 Tax=Candidatus Liberibacter americanus str. Sao Paulo TaxID=1261131 RepID=U6B583_9HYPH|nr:hydroxymethylglutaryl-CoA synthase [Candidatus Liberibacter americanus]AHA28070.1 3-hydroxy-3-methylglutaryl CoA synthase [Candidatus Liberibacter americanus str. Sao Paulo]EMS35961.1 hydroxymethylglutaryl-CoA synthase [Candidatus Liberibacter americanus PW_SP]